MSELTDRLVNSIINEGLKTFIDKLAGVSDEKLAGRVIEIWSFFFGTVLPYFQGVFLPLQMEMRAVQLQRQEKEQPTLLSMTGQKYQSINPLSIRMLLLAMYRNNVIMPYLDRMLDGFQSIIADSEQARRFPDYIPRMLQMLTILSEIHDPGQPAVVEALRKLKDDMRQHGRTILAFAR